MHDDGQRGCSIGNQFPLLSFLTSFEWIGTGLPLCCVARPKAQLAFPSLVSGLGYPCLKRAPPYKCCLLLLWYSIANGFLYLCWRGNTTQIGTILRFNGFSPWKGNVAGGMYQHHARRGRKCDVTPSPSLLPHNH